MQLPQKFLSSLDGVKGFDKDPFVHVHNSSRQVTSIRFNPTKTAIENSESVVSNDTQYPSHNIHSSSLQSQKVPWSQYGFYLEKRPSFTFDPLFHAGCYYVQEASGMFLEQAIKQTVDLTKSLRVLDLCAAPGGKSTHLQSLLSANSLLVSNEVIKPRAGILKQNITKWGSANVIVTSSDARQFEKLSGFFDVLVVDAPCSGSGLFRKDKEAINEWSPENVELCSRRQRQILGDVLPALKENGILIYATCSYSKEEDEDICDWLVEEMNLESISLQVDEDWNIVENLSKRGAAAYRFYPDKVKGEGFFLACFSKRQTTSTKQFKTGKANLISAKERASVLQWIKPTNELLFIKHESQVFAWPQNLLSDFLLIQWTLYIQYAGTALGEIIRDKLIPDHALALSPLLNPDKRGAGLTYEEAIIFLQRGELNVKTLQKGWQTVHYQNHPLGWINALPNRINNYYPKELRILKRDNDAHL